MRKLLTLLLVVAALNGMSQTNNVMFHMGYGTFSMSTQKQFQSKFTKYIDFPVTMRVVDEFPPYWTYGGSISFRPLKLFRFGVGLMYETGSTGGRLDYHDFSGSATLDQLLKYNQFGASLHIPLTRSEKWIVLANLCLSFVRTSQTLAFSLTAGNQSNSEVQKFQSANFGVRPGISVQRKVGRLLFEGSVAGEIQAAATLVNSDSGVFFRTSDGDVTAQWSGLRAQVGIGFVLQKSARKDLIDD